MNDRVKKYLFLSALFLFPLIIRLIYISQLRAGFLLDVPIIDADFYFKWAKSIAGGDILGKEVFLEGPLCPYILGAVFSVFGAGVFKALVFQSVIGSLSCLLIYKLAQKAFSEPVAVISWILASLYPYFLFIDGLISNEPYIMFFNLLLLYTLLAVKERPKLKLFLAAGLLFGISSLGRPNILLFLPLLILWLGAVFARDGSRKIISYAVCFACGLSVAFLAVGARNYAVSGRFMTTTSSAGINFWIGNGPRATGTYVCPEFCTANPFYEHEDYRAEASRRSGRQLDTAQASDFWLKDTAEHVIKHPGQWLSVVGKKALYIISAYEIPGNANFYFYRERVPLLGLPAAGAGLLIPLGIAGALFMRRWNAGASLLGLFAAAYIINNLLVFVLSEYRLPMVPVLMIFAADLVYRTLFTNGARSFLLGNLGKYLCLFLAAALFLISNNKSLWPMKSYANHYEMLGLSYFQNDRFDDALRSLNTALSMGYNTPGVHYTAGYCYREKNMLKEALAEFETGKAMSPTDGNFYREIAKTYRLQKRYTDAQKMFKEAIRLNPDDVKAKEYLEQMKNDTR